MKVGKEGMKCNLEMTVDEAVAFIEKLSNSILHAMRYEHASFRTAAIFEQDEKNYPGAMTVCVTQKD